MTSTADLKFGASGRIEEWAWQFFERDIRDNFWIVRPGDIVLDVGADFGAYTIESIASGGFVYAFEPRPEGARHLYDNLVLNGFQDRCKIIQKAAMSPAMTDYTLHMTKPGGMGSLERSTVLPGYYSGDTLEVTTTTIDEVVAKEQIRRVDWIKMDIEGAEYMALQGAARTIEQFAPNMLIECHQDKDAIVEYKILDLVKSLVPEYAYRKEQDLIGMFCGNFHLLFTVH